MSDTELDEIRAEFSALARKAFRAAESAARLARDRPRTPSRPRTTDRSSEVSDQETLAARWAAAEALREVDPDAADAWSAAMADTGVDVDAVRDSAPDSEPAPEPDRFTEYVADCVDDAMAAHSDIDWGDPADPGDWSNWGQGAHSTIGTAMARAATVADPPTSAPDTDLSASPPVEVGAGVGRDMEAGL